MASDLNEQEAPERSVSYWVGQAFVFQTVLEHERAERSGESIKPATVDVGARGQNGCLVGGHKTLNRSQISTG